MMMTMLFHALAPAFGKVLVVLVCAIVASRVITVWLRGR
jgi:hypothetical protein